MFGMFWWLAGVACAVWVIFDIVTYQKKMKPKDKLAWILAAIIPPLSIATAIVYYFVVKKK